MREKTSSPYGKLVKKSLSALSRDLKKLSAQQLEELLLDLLPRMNAATPLKQIRLAGQVVYLRMKRRKSRKIGHSGIQSFLGATENRAKGIYLFFCMTGFTGEAKDFIGNIDKKVLLIDVEQLANLLMDFRHAQKHDLHIEILR